MALRKGAAPATDNAVSRGRRVNDKQQRQPSSLISRPISSIHIGKRHREEMGDIDALARGIAGLGLLQPIVIRPDDRLIAGHRRLASLPVRKLKGDAPEALDNENPASVGVDRFCRGSAS